MKRFIAPRSIFFLPALTVFLLCSTMQAQEQKPASDSQPAPAAAKSSISTPRKVAGFGVLAFLIGWMFWKNKPFQQGKQDADDLPNDDASGRK